MDFRWVGFIALWTLLSGPILGTPTGPASGSASLQAKKQIIKPVSPVRTLVR